MPLQNRVHPDGRIVATAERGALMGNRGGRLHDAATRTLRRRWASKQWITCVLSFRNRHREVMGHGYTELFFLDEATALAAGHRPCFECRRQAALAFQAAFSDARSAPAPLKAGAMDAILHAQRRNHNEAKSLLADLPDGTMVVVDDCPALVWRKTLRPWSFSGYGLPITTMANSTVLVLTPSATVAALRHGYQITPHASLVMDA